MAIKAMLKSTNNINFTYLAGQAGDLSIGADGKFYFHFLNEQKGEFQTLSSTILGCMGSLTDPRSKSIGFQTKNSQYVFEKIDCESLYANHPGR